MKNSAPLVELSDDVARGFVVPIGGAESRSKRPTVLRRFIELCETKGSGANVGIIPTPRPRQSLDVVASWRLNANE